MNIKDLYIGAKRGEIPKSLLLYGEEEYPIVSYIRLLKSVVELPELNIAEFAEQFCADSLRVAFETVPLSCDYRLVILNKTGYFKWNSDDKLQALLADVPEHIRLVVFETDLQKISANYKRFIKTTMAVESKMLGTSELERWIKVEAEGRGLKLSERTLRYFTDVCRPRGMFYAKNAIDYLSSLAWEVSADDIDNYFGTSSDAEIWAFYDKLTSPEFPKIVAEYIDAGEEEMELFGRIVSCVRSAASYKAGGFRGTPFMERAAKRIAAEYSADQLFLMLEKLSLIDVELKSTAAPKRELLLQAAMLTQK